MYDVTINNITWRDARASFTSYKMSYVRREKSEWREKKKMIHIDYKLTSQFICKDAADVGQSD